MVATGKEYTALFSRMARREWGGWWHRQVQGEVSEAVMPIQFLGLVWSFWMGTCYGY